MKLFRRTAPCHASEVLAYLIELEELVNDAPSVNIPQLETYAPKELLDELTSIIYALKADIIINAYLYHGITLKESRYPTGLGSENRSLKEYRDTFISHMDRFAAIRASAMRDFRYKEDELLDMIDLRMEAIATHCGVIESLLILDEGGWYNLLDNLSEHNAYEADGRKPYDQLIGTLSEDGPAIGGGNYL